MHKAYPLAGLLARLLMRPEFFEPVYDANTYRDESSLGKAPCKSSSPAASWDGAGNNGPGSAWLTGSVVVGKLPCDSKSGVLRSDISPEQPGYEAASDTHLPSIRQQFYSQPVTQWFAAERCGSQRTT